MPIKFGAVGHPAWSHGDFTLSEQLDLIKQAGLSSYRVDAQADLLEDIIPLAAQKGVELLPTMLLHPEDYSTEAAARTAGYNLGNSLGNQFKGMTWNLGNEYDNTAIKAGGVSGQLASHYDDAKYAIARGLIDGMHDGVKAADPTAKTLVDNAGWYHFGFLDRLAADGVTWDITGVHWYSDMGSITNIGGSSTNALKENADFGKPIWVTEFNARPDQMTEAQMGTWATNFMTQLQNNAATYNVQQAHIYEILDQPELGSSPEARYGLFNTDGTFTPVGSAVDAYMDSLTTPPPPTGDTPTFTTANFTGTSAAETIIGNDQANIIDGAGGNDTIKGGLGNDKIVGNGGSDTMTGGGGNDLFDFNLLSQFGPSSARDKIMDFTPSTTTNGTQGDRIDLYDLIPGSAAFTYVGAAAHSGPASIRAVPSGSDDIIQGDINGDQVSDFSIQIVGGANLTIASHHFVL